MDVIFNIVIPAYIFCTVIWVIVASHKITHLRQVNQHLTQHSDALFDAFVDLKKTFDQLVADVNKHQELQITELVEHVFGAEATWVIKEGDLPVLQIMIPGYEPLTTPLCYFKNNPQQTLSLLYNQHLQQKMTL